MPTKLEVYNAALLELKVRALRGLSDARTERRSLDAIWSNTVDYMLERGMWNFATKDQQWMASDDVETQFGYQYAYQKPDDYMRLTDISANERYNPTLGDYQESGNFFFTDVEPLWVRFVSTDPLAGRDPGMWKPAFTRALVLELVYRLPNVGNISTNDREALRRERKRALSEAKSADAVNQAQSVLPPGRLVQARTGWRSGVNAMRRTPYQ